MLETQNGGAHMDAKATGALTAAAAVLLVLTACVAGLPPQNPPCIKAFSQTKKHRKACFRCFFYNTASDFVNIHHLTVFRSSHRPPGQRSSAEAVSIEVRQGWRARPRCGGYAPSQAPDGGPDRGGDYIVDLAGLDQVDDVGGWLVHVADGVGRDHVAVEDVGRTRWWRRCQNQGLEPLADADGLPACPNRARK